MVGETCFYAFPRKIDKIFSCRFFCVILDKLLAALLHRRRKHLIKTVHIMKSEMKIIGPQDNDRLAWPSVLAGAVLGVLLCGTLVAAANPVASPASPVAPERQRISDMFEMVYVEGGTFSMGASSRGSETENDEEPSHSVTLSSFYIGKYEVTQKQWVAIMGTKRSLFKGGNHPVDCVSWNDVQEFIRRLNAKTGKTYRLPTEAEWEYAARGGRYGDNSLYSGGDDIDAVAWHSGNSGSKTHPVGTKSPNALGIYDMSGNVWEWCSDWYEPEFPAPPKNPLGIYDFGTVWESNCSDGPKPEYHAKSLSGNPQGPSSIDICVIRGGSYNFDASSCRVSNRPFLDPDNRSYGVGFRLVLSE